MNCEQVEELLSAYLDNVLATEERRGVAAHLQECPRCSAVLADFIHYDTLLLHMPRVGPRPALRDSLFSSPEYLELVGTLERGDSLPEDTLPLSHPALHDTPGRPQLVAIPGGRGAKPAASSTSPSLRQTQRAGAVPGRRRRRRWGLLTMQIATAAVILLTLLVGGLIGRNLWLKQNQTGATSAITPPLSAQQGGPLPAGMRFVFLRDGALWSAAGDGTQPASRLTPDMVTVAANWVVSPPLAGRSAGDMLAYIDLQRAYVHLIRSDGQLDTAVPQNLLKAGTQPAAVWDTGTGATILNSLAWSKNGNMLAFVADPGGTGVTSLYIFSRDTSSVLAVPLPLKGSVSHPVWSPDGVRLAFVVSHAGRASILDYNTQNHGFLTIADGAVQANTSDTILTLDWSPNTDLPAITWSVGVIGHVHSIWLRHVGAGGADGSRELVAGDYGQATYSRGGHNGAGSWLLVSSIAGRPGDIWRVDVSAYSVPVALTRGLQVEFAQWSPDGARIDYLEAISNGVGTFHVIDTALDLDTRISAGVTSDPAPAWSADGQRLVYSTGTQITVINAGNDRQKVVLRLHGSASGFTWSLASPRQLIVALSEGQPGIYAVDTQHNTAARIDKQDASGGPLCWTEIP